MRLTSQSTANLECILCEINISRDARQHKRSVCEDPCQSVSIRGRLSFADFNEYENEDADARGASVATTAGLSAQRSVACNPCENCSRAVSDYRLPITGDTRSVDEDVGAGSACPNDGSIR